MRYAPACLRYQFASGLTDVCCPGHCFGAVSVHSDTNFLNSVVILAEGDDRVTLS